MEDKIHSSPVHGLQDVSTFFIQLAIGEIDLATGGDQGGSIRLPACWCGIVGLKPTYGLVPYTGCMPIDMTIDHCGPMARSVYDCALMLEVSSLNGWWDFVSFQQLKTLRKSTCYHHADILTRKFGKHGN